MAIPYIAAERGFIDAVIEPHQTRLLLRQSMRLLRDKEISRAAQARPDPDLSRWQRASLSSRPRSPPWTAALPFTVVADPDRVHYRRFGVETGVWAMADPNGTLVVARYGGRAAEDRPPARELTARNPGRRRRVHLP